MASKMVKATIVDFVLPKIGHVSLMITEETLQGKICEPCLFKCLPQDGSLRMFICLNRSRRDLYPEKSLRSISQGSRFGEIDASIFLSLHLASELH